MMYLVMDSTSIEYGKAVSQLLYRITKPDLTDSVTKYIGGVIQHPETGQVAVGVPNRKFLISPYSGRIIDLIFDSYAAQYLTPERNQKYRKWLKKKSGKQVHLTKVLYMMKEFQKNLLTETKALKDGWYTNDIPEEEQQGVLTVKK